MTGSWESANWAHGPPLANWVEQNVPREKFDEALERRIQEWRKPQSYAQFWTIDRILTHHGHHVSELPDQIWHTDTLPWRRSKR